MPAVVACILLDKLGKEKQDTTLVNISCTFHCFCIVGDGQESGARTHSWTLPEG